MKALKLLMALVLIVLLMVPVGAWADPDDTNGGAKGGGGGHTETLTNNLSFPVIMVENLDLPGTFGVERFTDPYDGFDPAPDDPDDPDDPENVFWFAQKTAGNEWQAESKLAAEEVFVDEVDWGDSLESVPMKVRRPVRIEATFYKFLAADNPMTGYSMKMLDNPSSPDEVQGAGVPDWELVDPATGAFLGEALTYSSYEATVYSPKVDLVIQQLFDPGASFDWDQENFVWTSTSEGAIGAPIPATFSSELNVAGKVIYGLSKGGWRPEAEGVYRITIYIDDDRVSLAADATIRESEPEESTSALDDEGPGGGTAFVHNEKVTYIDINVVAGGGGGGGKRPSTLLHTMVSRLLSEYEELVAVDIKPNACPNVINIDLPGPEGSSRGPGEPGNGGGKGSEPGGHLRAAVLGSETFDVADILLDSVRLHVPVGEDFEELMPEADHTVIEDVSTPFATTFAEPLDAYDCDVLGTDGFEDASFMFETPEIAELLAGTPEGTVVPLTLTGRLADNRTFAGVDLVLINEGGPVGDTDNTLDYTVFAPLVRKSGQ